MKTNTTPKIVLLLTIFLFIAMTSVAAQVCPAGTTREMYSGTTSSGKVFSFSNGNWPESLDTTETTIWSLGSYSYNNYVYAGSAYNGKIYQYDGCEWTMIRDTNEKDIKSIIEYNGKMFFSSGERGRVFIYDGSTNSWSSWRPSDGDHIYGYTLEVYNGKLYYGTGWMDGAIYVYDGNSWQLFDKLDDGERLHVLSLEVFDGKLYAGTNNGKLYSYNGAGKFNLVRSFPQATDVWSLKTYRGRLYVGTEGQGQIFSFDGSTWREQNMPTPYYATAVIALEVHEGILYAGTNNWARVYSYTPAQGWMHETYLIDEEVIYSLESACVPLCVDPTYECFVTGSEGNYNYNCDEDPNGPYDDYPTCDLDCGPSCGNLLIDAGETCDTTASWCRQPGTQDECTFCGDGIENGNEQCDDGNNYNDDECSNQCQINECILEIEKTDNPDPVEPGDDLSYQIVVRNAGDGDCTGTGVLLSEDYDLDTTFISSNPNPYLGDDLWKWDVLTPGEQVTVDILMRVSEEVECEQVLINEACVTSAEYDGDDVCDIEETTVDCPLGCILEIEKDDEKDPVFIEDTINYNIVIRNIGDQDCTGTGVLLNEEYDEDTYFISSVPAPYLGDDLWKWDVLHPGDEVTVEIEAGIYQTAECDQTLINDACVTSAEYDGNEVCDTEETFYQCPLCEDECDFGEYQCILDASYICGYDDDGDTCTDWLHVEDCDYYHEDEDVYYCLDDNNLQGSKYIEWEECNIPTGQCEDHDRTEIIYDEYCGENFENNYCDGQFNTFEWGTAECVELSSVTAECVTDGDKVTEDCGPDQCITDTNMDPEVLETADDDEGCEVINEFPTCNLPESEPQDFCHDDGNPETDILMQVYCPDEDHDFEPFDCNDLDGCFEFTYTKCVNCWNPYDARCDGDYCDLTGLEFRDYQCGAGECHFVPSEFVDIDSDMLDDRCDDCIDVDRDGACDDVDNCIDVNNPTQVDTDNDGMGNACDQDRDNDGYSSSVDCNDWNADVHPNAEEIKNNGRDDDCNPNTADKGAYTPKQALQIDVTYDEMQIKPGDEMDIIVTVQNNDIKDLEDLRLMVTVAGFQERSAKIVRDLKSGKTASRYFSLRMPEAFSDDFEELKISVSNDDYKRTIYRELRLE